MLDTKRSAMKIPARWKTTWCLGAFVAMMLAPRGEALAAERQLTEEEQAQINSYAELAKERRQANDIVGAIHYTQLALNISADLRLIYSMAYLRELNRELDLAASLYRLCTGSDADEETRKRAQTALARLEKTIPTGRVDFEIRPASATVKIDGKQVPLDAESGILLEEGMHRIEIEARGYVSQVEVVNVRRNETTRLLFSLPKRVANVSPVSPPPAPDKDGGIGAGTWVLLGAGIVLAVGGLATYVVGESRHSHLIDIQDEGRMIGEAWVSAYERQTALDISEEGKILKTVGVAGMTTGGGLIAVGVLLAALADDPDDKSADLELRSGPEGSELGLGIAGRF